MFYPRRLTSSLQRSLLFLLAFYVVPAPLSAQTQPCPTPLADLQVTLCGIDGMLVDLTSYETDLTSSSGSFTYATPGTSGPLPTDLILSEYVEGTGNNKAIEIYNGTGASVNLAAYSIAVYFNGNTVATGNIALSGTLANGATFVVANPSSVAALSSLANLTSGALNFNGNDVVALRKNGVNIDVFGQIGNAANFAVDITYRRKSSVIEGNPNGSAPFVVANEWDAAPVNSFDNIGTHSIMSAGTPGGTIADPTSVMVSNGQVFEVSFVNAATGCTAMGSLTFAIAATDTTVLSSTTCNPADAGMSTQILTNAAGCDSVVIMQVVLETALPIAVCQPITVVLDASGQASITASQLDGGSSATCLPLTLSLDKSSFDCADLKPSTAVDASDLFFSEYVEGSGFTKYLEIFNGTGAAVNLSGYQVLLYANGASTPTSTFSLSGMLANGEVLVLSNSQATAYTGPTVTSAVVNYNGDDAIALVRDGGTVVVDVFGAIGEDPGTQWLVSGISTLDKTLRRKANVSAGRVTTPGFPELAMEWEQFPNNSVDGLGTHQMDGFFAGVPVTLTVTDANGNMASCVANVTVSDPTDACSFLAPTNLVANGDTAFLAPLRWVDNSSNEDGFIIRRFSSFGTEIRDTVPANQTFYYDVVYIFGETVSYTVTAYRQATGESAPSNMATYIMPHGFDLLNLEFACYDPITDELTWVVENTNAQYLPFIWAQWWSNQRDTLYAVPNGFSSFQTINNPQDPNTFGDDNITGVWYWVENLDVEKDEVFSIPLENSCAVARMGHIPAAPKARRIPGLITIQGQASAQDYLASLISVSPNPFQTTVEISADGIEQVASCQVTNLMGQVLMQSTHQLAQPSKLELGNLAPGVYLLHIRAGNVSTTRKIVKE